MQRHKTYSHIYKSSDLSLVAAILSTKEAELVNASRVSPYKFEFHLSPAEKCLFLEREYINDHLIVSAKAIADNVRLLKSFIKAN